LNGHVRWRSRSSVNLVVVGANHLLFLLNVENGWLRVLNDSNGHKLLQMHIRHFSSLGGVNVMVAGGRVLVVDGQGLTALRP